MSGPVRIPLFGRRLLLIGLGIACVNLALIPLSPGGGTVPPDLLYCLVIAWALRDPAAPALWIILVLGLYADLMLSRPLGLGALGLLLASETARANATQFRGMPFLLEWFAAILGFALILAGIQAALLVTFAHTPGLVLMGRYLAATAIAYPLVAFAIAWGIGLRRVTETRSRGLPGRLM